MNTRAPITTHVLDISVGKAAHGVPVTLERKSDGGDWVILKQAKTNADGRVEDLMDKGSRAERGTYRLTFGIEAYYSTRATMTFYPEASVVFVIREPSEHHHVPLLLSPFGFSTYRGT
jgi:hydroxyisourate hydrolase